MLEKLLLVIFLQEESVVPTAREGRKETQKLPLVILLQSWLLGMLYLFFSYTLFISVNILLV